MRFAAIFLALATSLFILTGCEGNQSALDVHGSSAVHIKQLIVWMVLICSLVWTAVMVGLLTALCRSRRERSQTSQRKERRMTVAVAAAMGMTVVVIVGFTIASFLTTRELSEAKAGDLTIKVNGEQWWWKVTYSDANPILSFVTANEIHIPVGRTVRLQVEADDVIHSFWVPSLAGKQDLIPGRHNELAIRANRPGVYRGQCAEFCGLQHGHMAVFIVAQSDSDFELWENAQRQTAIPPHDTETRAGEAVFLSKPCAACHTVRGTDAAGTSGPDLTHVGSRKTIGAGLLETTRGSLAAWIADPQTLKPGNNMPIVPLSSDELRQVSAYIASLK